MHSDFLLITIISTILKCCEGCKTSTSQFVIQSSKYHPKVTPSLSSTWVFWRMADSSSECKVSLCAQKLPFQKTPWKWKLKWWTHNLALWVQMTEYQKMQTPLDNIQKAINKYTNQKYTCLVSSIIFSQTNISSTPFRGEAPSKEKFLPQLPIAVDKVSLLNLSTRQAWVFLPVNL